MKRHVLCNRRRMELNSLDNHHKVHDPPNISAPIKLDNLVSKRAGLVLYSFTSTIDKVLYYISRRNQPSALARQIG